MAAITLIHLQVSFEVPTTVRDGDGNMTKGVKSIVQSGEGRTRQSAVLDAKRKASLGAVRNVKVIKIEEV